MTDADLDRDDFAGAFAALTPVWEDGFLGHVVIDCPSSGGHDAVASCLEHHGPFRFYPWLADGYEDLTLPARGLREVDVDGARELFLAMASDAIRHGSHERLSDDVLRDLFRRFVAMFSSPRFFVNFSTSSWSPVTGHTRDSLLCVVDTARVGLWLSCDDE